MNAADATQWPRVELKSVFVSLRNGIFVSRPAASGPGIPIYRISAVRPMSLNVDDIRYAPEKTPDYERFLVDEGDLLFTRYSGNPEFVGACALVPPGADGVLHPDKLIRAVVDRDVADPAFLQLACTAGQTWEEIRDRRKTTAGQVGIAGKQLGEVSVPLPALDVQRRVVAHVTPLLRSLGQAEQHFDRARARLAKYREAVIGNVLRGELSTLASSTQHMLSGAPHRALADLASIQYGFTTKASPDAGGPKILRITDIQDGMVRWEDVPHCRESPEDPEKYALAAGDLVFARMGFTTGKSYLITDDVPVGAVCASYLIRVRFDADVDPEFVALFFQGSDYWDYVRAQRRGIDRPTLNGKILAQLPVPVPPLAAQREAVEHARRHLAAVEDLGARLTAQAAPITALRTSLVSRAVEGRLPIDDGALCQTPNGKTDHAVLAGR